MTVAVAVARILVDLTRVVLASPDLTKCYSRQDQHWHLDIYIKTDVEGQVLVQEKIWLVHS